MIEYTTVTTIASSFTTGNIKGTKNVGGIIGEAYVLSANNSYSTGTVLAEEEMAGGICGKLTIVGDIIACYSLGDISSPSFAGGLSVVQIFSLIIKAFIIAIP